jgi:5-methylcytosine-specific restriction endonuclease McrA
MPFLKPCLGAAGRRCPHNALTQHRSGRCDQCRRQRYRELYATTRSGHNDRRWREFRVTILRRDNYRCYVDGCDRKATDADHIVPVSRGGAEYDPDNCRAACEHHNRSRGARPN